MSSTPSRGSLARPYLLEAAALVALSVGVGVVHLGLRPELAWVADPPPPDAATCVAPAEPGDEDGQAAPPALPRMSAEDLRARLGSPGITVVDARTTAAFRAGHLPGALSLPADLAEDILGVQSVPIPPDDLVVTYCDGDRCELSEALGLALRERAGCRQVRVLEGGWRAWVLTGGQVERGQAERGQVENGTHG